MSLRDLLTQQLARRTEPGTLAGLPVLRRELTRAEYRAALSGVPMLPDGRIVGAEHVDRYVAGICAAGLADEGGAPIFGSRDEILALVNRADLWDALYDHHTAILQLSEVGDEALKSGDPGDDAGGAAGPG